MSTRTFEDAFQLASPVQGWMSEGQARRLWDAATRVPPGGLIVEIGSFHGRSAIVMASAIDDGTRFVAIDPHGGGDRGPQEISPEAERGEADNRAFNENIRAAELAARIEHVRLMSSEAYGSVEGAIDLLYVDGAHRFGPAREDIVEWGGRVRDGGTMLVHDSFSSIGVTLATLASLSFGSRWRYVGRTSSLAEYRREAMGLRRRSVNAARHLAQLPWFLRNVVVKVGLLSPALRPLARLMGHRGDDWPY